MTDTSTRKVKITKRFVDAAELPAGVNDKIFWDTELKGFGLRLRRTVDGTHKSYVIKYRDKNTGKQHKPPVGTYPPMPPEKARMNAMRQLASVQDGKNPAVERKLNRQDMTVEQLGNRFLTEYVSKETKPSTQESYKARVKRVVIPKLGKLKVRTIDNADIAKLKDAMCDTPYEFNRVRANLSKMFNLAEKWKLRDANTNPCKFIIPYPEKARQEFLKIDDIANLLEYLDNAITKQTESLYVAAAIKLYLYTGCRANEILKLKWEYVDYERALIAHPDSKTGEKPTHLSADAIAILKSIPQIPGNPYVIVGKNPGTHLVNIRKAWGRVRTAMGWPTLRIHDLRHTFASLLANKGHALYTIGMLLGSKTEPSRYAHLFNETLNEAVNDAANFIREGKKTKPVTTDS